MICKYCEKEFEEYKTEEQIFLDGKKHIRGSCPHCGKFQKYIQQGEDILYFVKYKGKTIAEVAKTDREYLEWLSGVCKHNLKEKIKKYL